MFEITINNLSEPYKNFILSYKNGDLNIEEFADLYCFWQDNAFMKSETLYTKAIFNFIFLLQNWKKRVLAASDLECVFLPFDFSDQYISGFHVLCSNTEIIQVSYVCADNMSGWSFSPTQINEMNPQKDEIIMILGFQEIKKSEFLNFIDNTVYKILEVLKDS